MTDDPLAGMPLYLRTAAERNMRAADRAVSSFNTLGQRTGAPAPTPNPSATPVPVPTASATPPISLNLGGQIDTSLGATPLPQIPVSTGLAPAASRATDLATPPPFNSTSQENFQGHMINPQPQTGAYGVNSGAYTTNPAAYKTNPAAYKTNPAAYGQTVSPRTQKLREDYGYAQ